MIVADIFKCAELKALQSRKKNTKVGALLLDANSGIILEACNDYIYPVYDSEDAVSEQEKKLYSEHAERRLIYSSIRSGIHDFHDKTLAVTHFPCCDCARAIILIGIKRLIVSTRHSDEAFYKKWSDNINVSHRMLLQNNVEISFFDE
jgi:dCMP deaminase